MADSKAVIEITGDASGLAKAVGQAKESLSTLERATKVIAGLNIAEWALRAGEAFKSWGERMFSLVEGLDDLSEKTSLSVEFLDKLQQVATIGGHSLNDITASAARLGKTFSEALGGDKDAARLFNSLGVALKDSAGQARSYDDVWQQTARTLVNAENQTVANAYAQKLMGKSVAELIPFLRDFDTYGDRASRVTAEQAAAAEKAKQEFNKLKLAGEEFGITLTNSLVPGITKLLEQMNKGVEIAGNFWAAFFGFGVGAAPGKPEERIAALREQIEKVNKDIATGESRPSLLRSDFMIARLKEKKDALEKQLSFEVFRFGQDPNNVPPDVTGLGGLGPKKKLDPSGLVAPDDSAAKEAERLRQLDLKGWVAYAEAVLQEAEDTDKAMAAIHDDRNKEEERLRQEDIKGWVAHAEAVIAEAEREDRALADIAEERQKEYEKAMADFQKMLTEINKESDKADKWARDLGLTFTSSFEDAIVKGRDLKTVLQSLIQDIAKLAIRETITKPGGEALSGLFKAGASALVSYFSGSGTTYGVQGGNPDEYYAYGGGRAVGGPVSAGSLYRVNESGMEYFRPNVDGQVIPMGQAGAGGTVVVHQNFSVGVAQTVRAEMLRLMPSMQRSFEASWQARRAQGGGYARA